MRKIMPAMALVALALAALAGSGGAAGVRLRMERVTVSGELNSLDLFDGGVIAVGGEVAVLSSDGSVRVEKLSEGRLLSVSCGERVCLAVGEKGSSIIYDLKKRSFSYPDMPVREYFKALYGGGRFYIAYRGGVMEYDEGGGRVLSDVRVGAVDIAVDGSGRLAILARDYLILGGGEVKLGVKGLKSISWLDTLYALGDGLYRLENGSLVKVLEGRYDSIFEAGGGLALSSKGSIYLWDGRGMRYVASIPGLSGLRLRGDTVYAVGSGGLYRIGLEKGPVESLLLPSGDYRSIFAADGYVLIVGEKTYIYSVGGRGYREVSLPPDRYYSASGSGGRAWILGEKGVVELSMDGSVKTIPLSAGGYGSIHVSGSKAYLAGSRGLFALDLEVYSVERVSEGSFSEVSNAGAVGRNVMLLDDGRRVSINFTGRGIGGIGCAVVAVGDRGSAVVYRYSDNSTAYLKTGFQESLTTIALNGRYGLAGGEGGGLYIFDGYTISAMPLTTSGAVRDIAWISDREALIISGRDIYKLVEEEYPEPEVALEKPEYVMVYNGTEARVPVRLKPVNGFSGMVDLKVFSEKEGVTAYARQETANVAPACPVELSLYVKAEDWARGSGRVKISYGGRVDELNVVVQERAPPRPERGPLEDLWIYASVAAAAALAPLVIIVVGRRHGRRGAEAGAAREPGGGVEEGEAEEW